MLRIPGLSPHFQCVLARPHRRDELTLRIEAAARHLEADERARIGTRLSAEIKSRIGVSVTVDVTEPETLERSVGKLRRIIDNWPKG